MINIALLGFGTVGSGCAEVIEKNQKIISARLGDGVRVKYILDLRDFPDSPYADRIVHDFGVIRDDPEISIVAEMMGGVHPAADFTRECLYMGSRWSRQTKPLLRRSAMNCLRSHAKIT